MPYRFQDRFEGGRCLAKKLTHFKGRSDLVVLALPRGGVPVGFEVAEALNAPLDVFVVRKLGVPGHEELAMGAIATGGVRFLNQSIIQQLAIPEHAIEEVVEREEQELVRREKQYRKSDLALELEHQVAILIDDGLATGATMQAAVEAVRLLRPSRVVVAVPVAAPDTFRALMRKADEVIAVETPEPFFAVGEWYEDFSQTTDFEVRALLERATKFQQMIPAHRV